MIISNKVIIFKSSGLLGGVILKRLGVSSDLKLSFCHATLDDETTCGRVKMLLRVRNLVTRRR
jgi:hypothetical protein